MLVAALVVYLMYVLMLNSISEMASAMPHTGGAYSFARAAMGPWGRLLHRACGNRGIRDDRRHHRLLLFGIRDAILSDLTGYSLDDHGLRWTGGSACMSSSW